MTQSVADINKSLLTAFIGWEKESIFLSVAEENHLSRPYVCSVSEKYYNAKKRIMIVGQETYDFPLYDDVWPEESIQKWGVDYLERQLWGIGSHKYNRSAFWKLFRYIDSNIGFCPCWNNVDKAHRIVDGKTVPLTVELEQKLNGVTLSNGHTILQEEIEITNPDAVLFITGPKYCQSMAAALNIDEKELSILKPSVKRICSDISRLSDVEVPMLWTYHPTFLNKRGLFTKTMEEISDWLS